MRKGSISIREPQAGAVRASPTGPGLARILLISTLAGLLLAVLGPFRTDQAPWLLRLGYWVGVVDLGGLLGWTTALVVLTWRPLFGRPWLQSLAVALVMTPPGAVMVWAWTQWVLASRAPWPKLLDYVVPVLAISLAMAAVNRLATRATAPAAPPAPGPPRFLKRLPEKLKGAELYALEAEDHYLRAHTSRGTDLILCRMADAVAELEGMEGLRTHRSWWVARAAVAKAVKTDGRAVLTLKSGVEAQVSRTALPLLRDKGWV